MEQNGILRIVGAVGAFLIIVVGAAAILYSPANNPNTSITSIENLESTWVSQEPLKVKPLQMQPNSDEPSIPVTDSLKPNPGTSPLEQTEQQPEEPVPNSVKSLNVYSGQTTVISGQTTSIDLNDITRVSGSGLQNQAAGNIQNTASRAPVQTGVVKTAQTAQQQTQPKPAASSSAKPAPAVSKPAAVKTVSAKTAPQTISDKYWIQAASYTSKKNAEELRAELSAEKINCEIFTFTDANGVLYYRVRVGPYSTKSEAEYWQTRVALVDRLTGAQTYITNSSAPKK